MHTPLHNDTSIDLIMRTTAAVRGAATNALNEVEQMERQERARNIKRIATSVIAFSAAAVAYYLYHSRA